MSIEHLLAGYRRFRQRHFREKRELYERLGREGQAPKFLVVGCVDSRINPAVITDADPGELLIVRNVASLIPPCEHDTAYHGTSAALEFGVRVLEVEHIIVMGHSKCGGAQALLEGTGCDEESDFIGRWMGMAEPVRREVLSSIPAEQPEARLTRTEQGLVRYGLANLMSYPWIVQRVQEGSLSLHGWHFDIASGRLSLLDPESDRFLPAPLE